MVDPEIELVVDPGRFNAVEQSQGLVDEVVIVEKAAPLLFAAITGQHRLGDGEEGGAAIAASDGIAPLQDLAHAFSFGVEPLDQSRILDRLGHDRFARGALIGAKNIDIGLDTVRAGARGERGEPLGLLAIGLGALRQRRGQHRPLRRRDQGAGEKLGFDAVHVRSRLEAERARERGDRGVQAAGAAEPALDHIATADRLAHHVAEGLVGAGGHGDAERAAERALGGGRPFKQHAQGQPLQQLRLLGLVEHAEAGGDVGFERKLMQELGAEGVDGLHLEAARRLQRARKQPPRQRPAGRAWCGAGAPADGVIERGIVERRPAPERVEHPLRHVRGRRLGEGDAENFFRLDAGEQKTDHALRQHMRLARSGIGRDPRRNRRIGDFALQPEHVGRNDARRSHGAPLPKSSSSGPPVADHSLTRARWS